MLKSVFLGVFALCTLPVPLPAAEASPGAEFVTKVLFVGNSLTLRNDLPGVLDQQGQNGKLGAGQVQRLTLHGGASGRRRDFQTSEPVNLKLWSCGTAAQDSSNAGHEFA